MPHKFMRLLSSWLIVRVLEAFGLRRSVRSASDPALVGGAQSRRDARTGHEVAEESPGPTPFARLLLSWLVLLLLGGAEFGISFLHFGRSLRPLLMVPAFLMAAVVAVNFMEVGKGPTIVRGFAVAALFWLIVLLALGSADPLTRTDYLIPHALSD